MTNSNPDRRAEAVSQASGQTDAMYLPFFEISIRDADARIREQTLDAVRSQKPEAQIPFFERASRDLDPSVRKVALVNIGELLQMKSAQTILSRLLHDENSTVREKAVSILARAGGPEFADQILALYKANPATPSFSLIVTLGRLRDPQSLAALKSILTSTNDDQRTTVISALGGRPEEEAVDLVIHQLDDKASDIRYAAVLALGGKSGSKVEDALIKVVNDTADEVRAQAILNLAAIPGLRQNPIYQQLIQDPLDVVSVTALKIFLRQHDDADVRGYYTREINGVHLNPALKTALKLEYNKRFGSLTRELPNLSCQAAFR